MVVCYASHARSASGSAAVNMSDIVRDVESLSTIVSIAVAVVVSCLIEFCFLGGAGAVWEAR